MQPGVAVQVAPTFGDAPGVRNSKLPVVQMRLPTSKHPAFHPQPALPAGTEWPEVTTVFCGPAQYKVTTLHSILNTAACLLILPAAQGSGWSQEESTACLSMCQCSSQKACS